MRCVALLSGGLDASLAVRLVQQQGIEVHALVLTTPLASTIVAAATAAADQLNVPLTVASPDPGYVQRLATPRLGRLGPAAVCLDCRVAMLRAAKAHLETIDAAFVVTGEVLGQRRRTSAWDLELVAVHAGLEGRVVRPLSAHRLPPTAAEERGWLNRHKLHGIFGKSRRLQRQLAGELGVTIIPPRPDCPLLAAPWAQRLADWRRHDMPVEDWLLGLLGTGRHQPLANGFYWILGRNKKENDLICRAFAACRQSGACSQQSSLAAVWLLEPIGVPGPTALVVGRAGAAHFKALIEALDRLRARLRGAAPSGGVRICGDHQTREISLAELNHLASSTVETCECPEPIYPSGGLPVSGGCA